MLVKDQRLNYEIVQVIMQLVLMYKSLLFTLNTLWIIPVLIKAHVLKRNFRIWQQDSIIFNPHDF